MATGSARNAQTRLMTIDSYPTFHTICPTHIPAALLFVSYIPLPYTCLMREIDNRSTSSRLYACLLILLNPPDPRQASTACCTHPRLHQHALCI